MDSMRESMGFAGWEMRSNPRDREEPSGVRKCRHQTAAGRCGDSRKGGTRRREFSTFLQFFSIGVNPPSRARHAHAR